jgi:hypothetical protein
MSLKNNEMYFKNSENVSERTYCWADDFKEMDFTKKVDFDDEFKVENFTKKTKIDKNTDNIILKLRFPMEFVPENSIKRLRVFIEISHSNL